MTEFKKKLIEVALPLEAINRESAREKSIRHGHPSTMHLWWSRKPLATCRAVLFGSLVDDPSAHPEEFPTEAQQQLERERLFSIIEELVKWENSTNQKVLGAARAEMERSCGGHLPSVLDPFCGGGSVPLESQRLGLEAHGSDLNPVAVVVTKALIEIPPKFADLPPVNRDSHARLGQAGWHGAEGLAEDVRHYGGWLRAEAERRVGHLYPDVTLPAEYGGGKAGVIAWLWARTVKCPNPACGAEMVLTSKWTFSTKKTKQTWVEPVVDAATKTVRFEIRTGTGVPPEPPKTGRGAKFRCLVCSNIAEDQHIKDEALSGRMGARLLAIAAEGSRGGRVYVAPDAEQVAVALGAKPDWAPEEDLPYDPRAIWCTLYGLDTYRDLFTARQLTTLTALNDLVVAARGEVLRDAEAAWPAHAGPSDATAADYADAVATYLALGVSKMTDYNSTLATWSQSRDQARSTFTRQGLPMSWDFCEVNPFAGAAGDLGVSLSGMCEALQGLAPCAVGSAVQLDATSALESVVLPMVSTDPPYYDNIGYAALSDYFYVWLRRSLRTVYPSLFSSLLTPKTQELVATPYRFDGSKKRAEEFFETGLGLAFARMHGAGNPDFPVTVYYAFKQAESKGDNTLGGLASTGWETMLTGLLRAGFSVTGTWPMRSERGVRSGAIGTNSLASSIVLVCRPRSATAALATRKEFISALRGELPGALRTLQHGNIAPVDLAQAAIGPGMGVFSRYAKVMEADGSPMIVRTALALINQTLDEILAEQEGEFDVDTRWAIAWFEQLGLDGGDYGTADVLARAKNTSVAGMVEAGILGSKGGKVRLLRRDELDEAWNPAEDGRLTVWEMTQYLIRALDQGEVAAASLARQLGSNAEVARDLAYRLYVICERKKWSQEGQAYNALVVAWPEIQRLAAFEPSTAGPSQTSFEV